MKYIPVLYDQIVYYSPLTLGFK